MGHDGDDLVSLPATPPPNPAARRTAIDTALRKFDGIEVPSGRQRAGPRLWNWASTHRRAAGGLVTAALVAVISIPVIQVALRDPPAEMASEAPAPDQVQPATDALPAATAPTEPEARANRPIPDNLLPNEPHEPVPVMAEQRGEIVAAKSSQIDEAAAGAPVSLAPAAPTSAAPPPTSPPPPPPPAAERQAADAADAGNIVVTRSRVKRANMESAAPVTVVDPHVDFFSRLRAALGADDRRAVIALIDLPLRVSWNGDTRTYRTRKDVERDFDRIFSPGVRQSLNNQLISRDSGRLKGNGRIWFGCGARTCPSAETIRIREVNP